MTTKKRIYWVTPEVTNEHKQRSQLLSSQNYDIRFFLSARELQDSLRHERASIVIVSDKGQNKAVEKRVSDIANMPDLRGSRLLLSVEAHNPSALRFAAAGNFRDLLPMSLSDKNWMQRFDYATAGRPITIAPPAGQLTMNQISGAHIPARLVWIASDKMRIETSLKPKVGSILNITGPIAEQMDCKSITFSVERVEYSHLRYRFSDALVGGWKVPKSSQDFATHVISSLRGDTEHRTCRILLVVKSNKIRQRIFAELKQPHYEINPVLKLSSLAQEVSYFSPHAVIMEDSLCVGQAQPFFLEMLNQLDVETPLLVVGKNSEVGSLVESCDDHKVVWQPEIPSSFLTSAFGPYLRPRLDPYEGSNGVPVSSNDLRSYIEVTTPARITRLHPHMVQIALPHRVHPFALCRISSPILGKTLGRDAWVKVTESFPNDENDGDEKFTAVADGFLSDLTRFDRSRMARSLVQMIQAHYKKLRQKEDAFDNDEAHIQNAPEVGTLKINTQAITTQQERPEQPAQKPAVFPMQVTATKPVASPIVAARPASQSRSIPVRHLKSAQKVDPRVAWLDKKSTKRLMSQLLTTAAVILMMAMIIWWAAQRDEETTQNSGKWFRDQISKFAPEKFDE